VLIIGNVPEGKGSLWLLDSRTIYLDWELYFFNERFNEYLLLKKGHFLDNNRVAYILRRYCAVLPSIMVNLTRDKHEKVISLMRRFVTVRKEVLLLVPEHPLMHARKFPKRSHAASSHLCQAARLLRAAIRPAFHRYKLLSSFSVFAATASDCHCSISVGFSRRLTSPSQLAIRNA
jgi:hypothetical protein